MVVAYVAGHISIEDVQMTHRVMSELRRRLEADENVEEQAWAVSERPVSDSMPDDAPVISRLGRRDR
ncbi:hypothetical protein NKI72_22380 [Mesorhizobium sp. M0437]|uniref:hypothetical protein n=1 Tax=unclassified Mesorhizobium TaxID=325217 RepID=UPI00333C163B